MTRIQITISGSADDEDENAVATLSEEGVTFDSADLGIMRISWNDLKRILEDPVAEEMLESADPEAW
jgi:hypothetical protein